MKERNVLNFYVLILLVCAIHCIQRENQRKLEGVEQENFIIAYYNSDVTYNKGFLYEAKTDKKVMSVFSRNSISGIKLEDSEEIKSKTDSLVIKANSRVEIHFSQPITSLESFFMKSSDNYMTKYLVSVDLSHFNATKLTTFASFLSGCTSLKTFIQPKTKTNELTNMYGMFGGCTEIESIDLSNLKTENVEFASYLFIGCCYNGENVVGVIIAAANTGLPVIGLILLFPLIILTIISICTDNIKVTFARDVVSIFGSAFILASSIIVMFAKVMENYYVPIIIIVCTLVILVTALISVFKVIKADELAKKNKEENIIQ